MTRAEHYENVDKIIFKERNPKKEKKEVAEEVKQTIKGGEGFVCSLECKTCGAA